MTTRRQTYLIQDPYDPYAIQFIRTIFTYFGLRPVCFHTDAKARYYGERTYRLLTGDLIEASFDVDLDDLASFADTVRERYDVVGIVPWGEVHVGPAAELCRLLDLSWNDPDVLARFRDKNALKDHVGAVAPHVRVPVHRIVRSVTELTADEVPKRFVLKPNDGYGNMSIGVFDADELDAARRHIAAEPDVTWILEEYIGGTEYHIDGQVRETGDVVCLAVFEYVRTEVNGYATVYLGEIQLQTSHPVFDELVDYTRRLLTATGLRRCPFHLEVKVDERGPCVIDLGARLPSDGGGPVLGRMHPYRPDPFAIAASDYLGGELYPDDVVDWTHYDRSRAVFAYGVSCQDGLIESVSGLDEVEAMPEFVVWTIKPNVGDPLVVTKELRGAPFIAELTCTGSRDDAFELAERVRSTVVINAERASHHTLAALGRNIERRLRPKARWLARCVADRFVSFRR